VVWIPKDRRKKLFVEIRRELGPVLRQLAQHKASEILEGNLLIDHVHMLIALPPKYAVAQVIGYLKGKSAIHIARAFGGRQKSFTGEHFWAQGYYVSTVGIEEAVLRRYIQQQEDEDRRLDQLRLFD
jgi:putative transposase